MTEPMPASELDAIRARHAAATEGPWWFDEDKDCWRLHGVGHRFPPQCGGAIPEQIANKQILKAPKQGTPYAEYWPDEGDSPFIVNAWTDMGALLAEVERLRDVEIDRNRFQFALEEINAHRAGRDPSWRDAAPIARAALDASLPSTTGEGE